MTFNRALLSSFKQDWKTPKKIYEELNKEFHFDFDPCPSDIKVNWNNNGLSIDWGNSNFVNPPYKEINKWISKAYKEWKKGKTIVLLIPSRTDTKWWHEFIMQATEIRFIKGRLKFEGAKNSAPFPSCVVIFR